MWLNHDARPDGRATGHPARNNFGTQLEGTRYEHWYLHISFDFERVPTDPVSVEAVTEKLSTRGITSPLPTDPVSVEAVTDGRWRPHRAVADRGVAQRLALGPRGLHNQEKEGAGKNDLRRNHREFRVRHTIGDRPRLSDCRGLFLGPQSLDPVGDSGGHFFLVLRGLLCPHALARAGYCHEARSQTTSLDRPDSLIRPTGTFSRREKGVCLDGLRSPEASLVTSFSRREKVPVGRMRGDARCFETPRWSTDEASDTVSVPHAVQELPQDVVVFPRFAGVVPDSLAHKKRFRTRRGVEQLATETKGNDFVRRGVALQQRPGISGDLSQ